MKTPITYYGGKQTMLKFILPLLPKHQVYVESFAGGAVIALITFPYKIRMSKQAFCIFFGCYFDVL
jgi:site-specific DNA-adenine methylase